MVLTADEAADEEAPEEAPEKAAVEVAAEAAVHGVHVVCVGQAPRATTVIWTSAHGTILDGGRPATGSDVWQVCGEDGGRAFGVLLWARFVSRCLRQGAPSAERLARCERL
eukprot:CAMPEP_0174758224 /NCGR_PEP_ID=MMETSP1094-20130205/107659_1 /TAXON_ID=156173 /ORGANISM="Chrysochromulina brevifilum, Strain UTEX LB 985" /LENGTH=110 /DNA_ID=CAMNT_0015964151 /DNA_START=463 /DNA_END=796 /DNA_ORIENTATION=+